MADRCSYSFAPPPPRVRRKYYAVLPPGAPPDTPLQSFYERQQFRGYRDGQLYELVLYDNGKTYSWELVR